MNADRLAEAVNALEAIYGQNFRSDPERDEAVRKRYDYLIVVLADEVMKLNRVVKSICDDRI